jgi:hypothetical protein
MAKPLGGPKVELTKPAYLLGTFVSRTSWGLILLWLNLIPLLHRGSEFRAEGDGSVMVRRGDSWEPLLEYQYSSVTADGGPSSSPRPPTARRPSCCRSRACSAGRTAPG